jgi:glutamyl/glutaminyl-tRNA synthetase
MGITRVVRGADLLTSTPKQITLLNALELPVPAYMHVPLVRDQTGNRLSKRDGAQSLEELLGKSASLEDIVNRLTNWCDGPD